MAGGPLPIGSTFDHGFELVLSEFVVPKKWEVYGRTSFVFGQFGNSYQYAPGVKWYPVGNHRVWLVAEEPSRRPGALANTSTAASAPIP